MKLLILFSSFSLLLSCVSETKTNNIEPTSSKMDILAKLIRIDFNNNSEWDQLREIVDAPDSQYGFKAYVEFVNDSTYKELSHGRILDKLGDNYDFDFYFLADEKTFETSDFHILCVGIPSPNNIKGGTFRIKASELWIAENNLSISNMDFDDFTHNLDENGVYEGFD